MERIVGRKEMITTAGVLAVESTVGILGGSAAASAGAPDDALLGIWLVNVVGSGGSYNYFYSFARGGYTATGDVDERFLNMKYSPTMGAYVRIGTRSVRYREKGWVYDLAGKNIGTFGGVGTFTFDHSAKSLVGPGVFTQYDLKGRPTGSEKFVANGKKIEV